MKIIVYKSTVLLSKIFSIVLFFWIYKNLIASLVTGPGKWAIVLTGLTYFGLEYHINLYASALWQKILLPEIRNANLLLDSYNKKLNSLVNTGEIREEFLFLFNSAFASYHWCILWLKGNTFSVAGGSGKCLEKVDWPLSFSSQEARNVFLKESDIFIGFKELIVRELPIRKYFIEVYNHCRFKYFIPVKSSHKVQGFVLFDHSLDKFLSLRSFRQNLEKIIHKTSEIVETASLYEEVEMRMRHNEMLLQVSKIITSSLNLREVLAAIIKAVAGFVKFDAAAIFLVDEHKQELKNQYIQGYDKEESKRIKLKINQGIIGRVIQSGKASNIPDVELNDDYFPLRKSTASQLTIPLYAGDKPIGAIGLESDKKNNFSVQDEEILQIFAGHASIAINNANLYKTVLEKKELESDLLNASKVQKSLLINRLPHLPGIETVVASVPCKLVGGDFYEIQHYPGSSILVSVGDVSGKGAPAALLMAFVLTGLRSYSRQVHSVCEVTARVNNLMTEVTTDGKYATMFLAEIDTDSRRLSYTNAGHNAPALIKKDGSVKWLTGGGIVIGFRADFEYKQMTIDVEEGDILFMYTDGVSEAQDESGKELGVNAVVELITAHKNESLADLKEMILDLVRSFSAGNEFEDDLTFILMRWQQEKQH